MSLPHILVGCDPEMFVRNTVTGQLVSAWGMIPGDKHNPHPVDRGAIQVDGMAVEFNINPAATLADWNDNIGAVREALAKALPPDHELVISPTADFDPAYFASLPDESKVLGCDPDFNAYTKGANPRPDGNPPFRTASGHIHSCWLKPDEYKKLDDADHIADCIEVVKQLDYYVGLPSMVWDPDMRRRKMYGKAGTYRIKPYGVEYRTPSNMWLTQPRYQEFVFKATQAAIQDLFDGNAMRVNLRSWAPQNYIDTGYSRFDRNTCEILGGYAPRLKEIGLYDVYDFAKEQARQVRLAAQKPIEIQVKAAAAAVPDQNFRWRGLRLNEIPRDMLRRALEDVQHGVLLDGMPREAVDLVMAEIERRERPQAPPPAAPIFWNPAPLPLAGAQAGWAVLDEVNEEGG